MGTLTLTSILDGAVENFGDSIAVRSTELEEEFSFAQVKEHALRVRTALESHGVGEGDRVVIFTGNNPSFLFADYGVLYAGATSMPLDDNISSLLLHDAIEFVDPKLVLVEGRFMEKVRDLTSAPLLAIDEALNHDASEPNIDITEDDLAALILSSGTSSDSEMAFKVVMLSHRNIASNIASTEHLTKYRDRGTYITGVAPQWHSFEYNVQKAMLNAGVTLHFTKKEKYLKGIAGGKINPDYMIMTPAVANFVMEKIKRGVAKKGNDIYSKFESAIENSSQYLYRRFNEGHFSIYGYIKHKIADYLIYRHIREELQAHFGNRNPMIVGGSAHLDERTQLFFYAIGLPIYQGYGLTEASPVVSVNTPDDYRFGSSGKAVKDVDIMTVDPKTPGPAKRGLILVKGPNIFKGYYGQPDLTDKAFHDGCFVTGDTGMVDNDGFVYIKGRSDRCIKLTNGEFVNPESIEAYYQNHGPISRLICVGDGKQKLGVLVVPNEEKVTNVKEAYRKNAPLGETVKYDLLNSVAKTLRDAYDVCGHTFKEKNITLVLDFDPTKYLTSIGKLRYNLFLKDHAPLIEQMYSR